MGYLRYRKALLLSIASQTFYLCYPCQLKYEPHISLLQGRKHLNQQMRRWLVQCATIFHKCHIFLSC